MTVIISTHILQTTGNFHFYRDRRFSTNSYFWDSGINFTEDMDQKKDAQGNKYAEVPSGDGKGNIRVTYVKSKKMAQITVGEEFIICKAEEIPNLIEALAMAYTESVT